MDAIVSNTSRLSELEHLHLQDHSARPELDMICQAALESFEAKVVDVSIVDHQNNISLARVGPALPESPLTQSIAYAVLTSPENALIIDAGADAEGLQQWQKLHRSGFKHLLSVPIKTDNDAAVGALTIAREVDKEYSAQDVRAAQRFSKICIAWLRADRLKKTLEQKREVARLQTQRLKQQQQRIASTSRILHQISRMAQIGGWEYNVADDEVNWTDEMYEIYQLSRDVDVTMEIALKPFPEDVLPKVKEALDVAVHKGVPFKIESKFNIADGAQRWVRLIGEVHSFKGKTTRVYGALQDITDQVARENEIRHIGAHDGLTGLPNRNYFSQELARALKEAALKDTLVALMLIDVDNFKTINDTFGHDVGDDVLIEFSNRLKSGLRPSDTVARLGGDEFALILPNLETQRQAELIARRVHDQICHTFPLQDEIINVNASLGIALFPDHTKDAKDLLKKADIALYDAKYQGKACLALFNHQMEELISVRHETLKTVSAAIQRQELQPFYQPIVDGNLGQVEGFEALVRWVKPHGQVLPPAYFEAALHDAKLSRAIGKLMRDSVLDQIVAWTAKGVKFGQVSINVASHELQDGTFATNLVNAIRARGIQPHLVTIEVTESVLLSKHSDIVAREFNILAEAGIAIALDDFGTGYASLTHLKQFQVDVIKIDRSFVSVLPEDRESLGIVKAISALALNLGKTVVAEGIETRQQADLLTALGCNLLQGYFFAKPSPAGDVPQLIRGLSSYQSRSRKIKGAA